MPRAAGRETLPAMETFWAIVAYAFVLGLGALGGLVMVLWLNAAKVSADAHYRPPADPGPQGEREPETPPGTAYGLAPR
jgi:hypothetical protein